VNVSPRPYRLGKRQADVEETRERIVAAATELFGQSGFYNVSLDDVARAAGVARATVYYQFESKSGLLDAVVASIIQRVGVDAARRAREHPDAALAVRLYVREVVLFWSRDDTLVRNLHGLAGVDADAGRVIEQYDGTRKDVLAWLVKRLDDQGKLRKGVSQKHAVDLLWMLTGFRSFDQLYSRSGMSARATAALLSDLATRMLLTDA
jgi:AcrR family transcriptional regulator